jgi:uncharacterized membrane protein YcaP (DUF421 family)
LYLVLIAVVRLMGKLQVGQMEPSEFMVTMLVANLASSPMENDGIPLYAGVVPILTVLGLELVLSVLSFSSVKFRRILCGKPVILIENGKILQENLRKTRITADELTGHLRLKEVLELRTVQYAILETNGELSVFLYPPHRPAAAEEAGIETAPQSLPVTVIQDGKLLRKNLTHANKTMAWVRKTLKAHQSTVQGTYLLTVDRQGKEQFIRREEPK